MSGLLPWDPDQGTFFKSPLEPQKLLQKQSGVFEGNSLAYLSYKKGRFSIRPDFMASIFSLIRSSSQSHHFISSSEDITSSGKRFFIGFAGTPPTTVYGGTSFVTTARVPIIAPSPI